MKKFITLVAALALIVSLAACQEKPSSSVSDSSASQSSSAEKDAEESSEAEESEEESSEADMEEEELVEEEGPLAAMTGGENSISVVLGEDVLAQFTLPTETAVYSKLTYSEGSSIAQMMHPVMDGVSGSTIIEVYNGTSQEYYDEYKSIAGVDGEDAEMITKDLDGREVLIGKAASQSVNDMKKEVCSVAYLVCVPVSDNVTLGFRIGGSYGVGNELVLDDSVIDILLSHCAF